MFIPCGKAENHFPSAGGRPVSEGDGLEHGLPWGNSNSIRSSWLARPVTAVLVTLAEVGSHLSTNKKRDEQLGELRAGCPRRVSNTG